jgi:hypothetical protein
MVCRAGRRGYAFLALLGYLEENGIHVLPQLKHLCIAATVENHDSASPGRLEDVAFGCLDRGTLQFQAACTDTLHQTDQLPKKQTLLSHALNLR